MAETVPEYMTVRGDENVVVRVSNPRRGARVEQSVICELVQLDLAVAGADVRASGS